MIEKTRKQRNLLKALKVLIRSILKLKHAFKSRRSFWPNLRFKQGRSQWDVKIAVKTCDTETLLKTCNTENPVGKTLTEKRKKSDIINRSHRNLNKVYPKVIVFQCELWKIGTKSLKTECALSTKGGKSASVLYVSTRELPGPVWVPNQGVPVQCDLSPSVRRTASLLCTTNRSLRYLVIKNWSLPDNWILVKRGQRLSPKPDLIFENVLYLLKDLISKFTFKFFPISKCFGNVYSHMYHCTCISAYSQPSFGSCLDHTRLRRRLDHVKVILGSFKVNFNIKFLILTLLMILP